MESREEPYLPWLSTGLFVGAAIPAVLLPVLLRPVAGSRGVFMRTYPPIGDVCSAYDRKTCNVLDPETNLIATGTLAGCEAEMKAEYSISKKLQPLTPQGPPAREPIR
jgi:hypothetical protein